ncbi:uncharacterized protein [Fopius arisanus]|uniref:Uncharacterized protein n=1 Tax=Fopius arisanus TaxID=64838 RepID=A0A9R1UAR0_9HYME|nr:PREDICTED: uncharacterized protein LOC105273179 [Fopius arisanus]
MKNSDMTAYKRQYYDSLLNYQRAKAVTNSMTPMPSTSTYDSSYYEYLQQHQWMYQQRLIMGHQYAQRLIQPEFSPLRNPYGRFNEWMPNCTTSRQSQEAFGYYSTNCPPDYEAMAKHKSNFSGESEVKKE